MNYGLPYVGSKNKIAKTIIDFLPPADHFYDLFAGGCAITHAAILSNKYKIFHVNDINIQYPAYFADIISGKRKVSYSIYTRNIYNLNQKFGNDVKDTNRKRFKDEKEMNKYIEGRKKYYSKYFEELYNHIFENDVNYFKYNGILLKPYTIAKK